MVFASPAIGARACQAFQTALARLQEELSTPIPAGSQASSARHAFLSNAYTHDEIVESAMLLELDHLRLVANFLLRPMMATMFSSGNLLSSHAELLFTQLRRCFPLEIKVATITPLVSSSRIVMLPTGRQLVVHQQSSSKDSAACDVFFPICGSLLGLSMMQSRCVTGLLCQMLHERFFDRLRTHQQCGYSVSLSSSTVDGWPGMALAVQSDRYDAEELYGRIWKFLVDSRHTLSSMSREDFDRHRSSLIKQLEQPDPDAEATHDRLWEEIIESTQQWERNRLVANALLHVDLALCVHVFDCCVLGVRSMSMAGTACDQYFSPLHSSSYSVSQTMSFQAQLPNTIVSAKCIEATLPLLPVAESVADSASSDSESSDPPADSAPQQQPASTSPQLDQLGAHTRCIAVLVHRNLSGHRSCWFPLNLVQSLTSAKRDLNEPAPPTKRIRLESGAESVPSSSANAAVDDHDLVYFDPKLVGSSTHVWSWSDYVTMFNWLPLLPPASMVV